jgi:peptide deformylase
MPLLRIAHYPEPVLLTVGKPVLENDFGVDLERLVGDMFETMYEAGGVGLAAPQVFDSRRPFRYGCAGRGR